MLAEDEQARRLIARLPRRLEGNAQHLERRLVRAAEGGGQQGGRTDLLPLRRAPQKRPPEADFGGVRIHTDAGTAVLSRQLSAKAFTTDNHIFFGGGQYQPETATGRELIAHELELISELNYASYFLTVHDIVRFAKSRDILCQGRGSAANSAVCYCLGITAVDPGRFDLLFERFVSAERNEPPDIDVDFEHERREEVIQYVYNKYGRHRAALAATVICYRPKSAVRDVGKALGLSLQEVDRLAKGFAFWDTKIEPLTPVLEFAAMLRGFPRHLSQHVGGFVISRGPLAELVPIENAAMPERTVIQWDKDDLEALGLLKVDVLAWECFPPFGAVWKW